MAPGERSERLDVASQVGAVVLAAGQSRRMGTPKLVLPWGRHTVIEQVVQTLIDAGLREIVVVTGGDSEMLQAVLAAYPVRMVPNLAYVHTEMVATLQVGIQSLSTACHAALIVLGDQPTIEAVVVRQVIDAYHHTGAAITIPSYHMRRGHPWLVDRKLWSSLLNLTNNQTMRDFLQIQAEGIAYIQVDTPGILTDIDTPEDYQRHRPK